MEFEENGSKYNERIIVDKKKGFLLYDVPKHGDIEAAKFLKDFNIVSNNVVINFHFLYFVDWNNVNKPEGYFTTQ